MTLPSIQSPKVGLARQWCVDWLAPAWTQQCDPGAAFRRAVSWLQGCGIARWVGWQSYLHAPKCGLGAASRRTVGWLRGCVVVWWTGWLSPPDARKCDLRATRTRLISLRWLPGRGVADSCVGWLAPQGVRRCGLGAARALVGWVLWWLWERGVVRCVGWQSPGGLGVALCGLGLSWEDRLGGQPVCPVDAQADQCCAGGQEGLAQWIGEQHVQWVGAHGFAQ